MTENIDEIKAVLEDLSTSDLTCSARLVAVIHALGIEEPKEIERLTGLKPAGARKARCQLKEHRHSGGATPVARHSSSATVVAFRHSGSAASRVGDAHAHKEYPSDINISLASKLATRENVENEIEGLNGSTSKYVGWLADWLSPYSPDLETARSILESNVHLYGAAKVQAGMLELKIQIAGGDPPRNLVKAFSGYVKAASTDARQPAQPQSKTERKALAFEAAMQEAFHGGR